MRRESERLGAEPEGSARDWPLVVLLASGREGDGEAPLFVVIGGGGGGVCVSWLG